MILLEKNKSWINSFFHYIKIASFLIFCGLMFGKITFSKIIVNINNSLDKYMVTLTYYYPGDNTGSGSKLGSGLTASDFTLDNKGWYHYQYNGTDYLVVAAATTYCRDSYNHCGIDSSRGIAQNITYYKYYDTLVLNIDGQNYNAMVLDSCGACMWKERDNYGEKIDIFSRDGNSINPNIYSNSTSVVTSNNNSNIIFDSKTDYEGDITQGYIYKTQYYGSLKINESTTADEIEARIDQTIDNIFENASNYSNISVEDFEIVTDNKNALNWKQYDAAWGSIPMGNSGKNIKQIGCLATSVSIEIALSGTKVNTDNFNPGTFIQYLNGHGGFDSRGQLYWDNRWSGLVPNFQFVAKESLGKTKQEKINKISDLLNSGYYVVMCSKTGCGHWVAVTGVTSDNINIADPGSSATTLWPKYNAIANDSTLKVSYFKKLD